MLLLLRTYWHCSFPLGIGETVQSLGMELVAGRWRLNPALWAVWHNHPHCTALGPLLKMTACKGWPRPQKVLECQMCCCAFFGCYTPPCGQCGVTIQSLEAKTDCLELNGGGKLQNGCAFPSMRRPKSRICSSIQRISASSSAGRAAQAGASIRHRKMLSWIFDQGPNSFKKKDTNCCVQTHQQDPHEAKL